MRLPDVGRTALDVHRLRVDLADARDELDDLRAAIRADFLLHRGDDSAWNELSIRARRRYEAALHDLPPIPTAEQFV